METESYKKEVRQLDLAMIILSLGVISYLYQSLGSDHTYYGYIWSLFGTYLLFNLIWPFTYSLIHPIKSENLRAIFAQSIAVTLFFIMGGAKENFWHLFFINTFGITYLSYISNDHQKISTLIVFLKTVSVYITAFFASSYLQDHYSYAWLYPALLQTGSIFCYATLMVIASHRAQLEAEKAKSTLKKLEETQARLVESDKFSALGTMAAGIAHEINNPLAIIEGNVQLMMIEIKRKSYKDLEKRLESIKTTVTRIAKIVVGIKSYSRDSSNDPYTPHPIEQIINESVTLCEERFMALSIKLVVEADGYNEISCRPSELSQVLLNLLNNAADEIEGSDAPWIKVKISANSQWVRLTVSDSGKGIPEDVAAKIFDPFFTSKDIGKGTGLGLSIAKGIISKHKGKLYVDKNSKNTCFVIELPLLRKNIKAS